ncbi:hypothetical protein [Pengzhenrongella frigida]|uniref:hypothetical protein n=1 Tax=Pengzhenrongella frigida TaxID=1259133 RepID=UPI0013EC48CD|nr:hypothetical protein [Cellulomonas sp. HLT2-17]
MTRREERLGGLAVLGLLAVPLLVGVLLAWGLSAPVKHLDRVTAAVVNNDTPVTINGQTVPVGRELAAGLVGGEAGAGAPGDPGSDATAGPTSTGPNVTWVLTNDADAAAGLAAGTYAAVVTIPSSFSASATSISGPAASAVKATVEVTTTPATAFLDPALTQLAVQAAVATLNSNLTERYLSNVYQGFNQLSSSIAQAADGAAQLASGASSLAEGADQLAVGADELSAGLDSLQNGASSLAAGLTQLDASVQGRLPEQAAQLATGAAQVASALDARAAALSSVTQELAEVVAAVCEQPGPLCDRATISLARLQTAYADVAALASGADAVAAGNGRLAARMPGLVDGLDSASSGAAELADGAASLASGGAAVAEGADGVASGAESVDQGAASLSSGLGQAVAQIPTYSSTDITTLSSVVAQPVDAAVGLPATGTQSVPLFAVIALWVGGIVIALAHRALPSSRLLTAESSPSLAWRSAWPVAAIGAGQGVLVAVALVGFLDAGSRSLGSLVTACVAIGVVFALVNEGLAALLGGTGRMLAVVVAVIALVVGTASTAPAAFESAAGLLPTGPARDLLLAVIGVGSAGPALIALTLWGVVGAVLVLLDVARRRTGVALVA